MQSDFFSQDPSRRHPPHGTKKKGPDGTPGLKIGICLSVEVLRGAIVAEGHHRRKHFVAGEGRRRPIAHGPLSASAGDFRNPSGSAILPSQTKRPASLRAFSISVFAAAN